MERSLSKLRAELEAKLNKVSGLLSASTEDIAALRESLELLKTSSNATFGGTLVFRVIEMLEKAIAKIESKSVHYEHQIVGIISTIVRSFSLTQSIAVKFTGDSDMSSNALVLNVGQTSQASIVPLLADGTTPSGGTLSAVSYTFSDPSATVVLNSDGLTATVTGVAASAGAVSGSASCTVTDTDGVVSKWTQAFTITTNAVAPPPAQLTQSVAVEFSTPTP